MKKKILILFTFCLTTLLPITYGSELIKNSTKKTNVHKVKKKIAKKVLSKVERLYNHKKLSNQKKYRLLVFQLYKDKLYFSSLYFAIKYLKTDPELDNKITFLIDKLLLKTGVDSLNQLSIFTKKQREIPSISLALGLKLFKAKKFERAYNILEKIPNSNRFAPEARMTMGTIDNLIGNHQRAYNNYNTCQKIAKNEEEDSTHVKQKRYFAIIKESCHIHIARIVYKMKQYKHALKKYNDIPKKSYMWPYLLLEKAWSHYHLKEYNRALGLLVTYKSPLLSSYFSPEGEVLTAMSYYNMCLYGDALNVVHQFYNVFKPATDELKILLNKHKQSDDYFIKMVIAPKDSIEYKNLYIRSLSTQIRKKIKFSLDYFNISKAKQEFKEIAKFNNSKLKKDLKLNVNKIINKRSVRLNNFIKFYIFNFINDIHRYSYDMFNLKLDIMSKQRHLLYQDKKLTSTRSRGSIDNIDISVDQDFWDFNGSFWADEIGEYSFGLKSKCKSVNAILKRNRRR